MAKAMKDLDNLLEPRTISSLAPDVTENARSLL